MEYTKNYHLPQWVKSDRIMMDDFNDAMASMENGMTATRDATQKSIVDLDGRVAAAEKTANDAKTRAETLPYVVGTYIGNGGTKEIELGFKPSFLIISGMYATAAGNSTEAWDRFFGMTGGNAISERVKLTNTGFTVYARVLEHLFYPDFSENGRRYDYIAFK